MESEAPQLTKNSLSGSISRRNSRVKLHRSGTGSGSGAGAGSDLNLEKLTGWKGSSTCRTASFPTPSRVFYSFELYLHASCDTNRGLEMMKNERMELELGNA